ncbi:MAG: serine proteinase inhibitor IA-1 [Piptocephalis tieghemiana]|nr:MAG: serine proteinase inhibitor IA-1 [Piptocephalis tieghemiana]
MSHGKYIVVFKKDAPQEVIDKMMEDVSTEGGKIEHHYKMTKMRGFSASIPDAFLTNLTGDQYIETIEPDGEVTTMAKSLGIGA